MSQIITYKCDSCGKESTDKDKLDLAIVAIGVKRDYYGSFDAQTFSLLDNAKREKEMCKICRIKLGILPPGMKKEEVQTPVPTLEDMIREIIRDEISNH
jgi:hypothetical protein